MYTFTRVHARIPNGHHREEKRACRTKVPGQLGEDRRACPGSWRAERAARAATGRLPCEDPRAKVGEKVRVGVGVRVGPVEFKLKRVASWTGKSPDTHDLL